MPHGFAPAATPAASESVADAIRQAATGNRLRDGIPVYFTAEGAWSPAIDDAAHVAGAAADALLREAQSRNAAATPDAVIAPYLIEVVDAGGRLRPVTLRERIRAFGPTTRRAAG